MASRKKSAQSGAAALALLNGLWGAYSSITTARDLAGDAGEVRKMMADPPFELPWILAGLGCIALVLIWRFWAEPPEAEDDFAGMSARTSGTSSPVFQQTHSGTGDIVGIGTVENVHLGPPKIVMSDALIDQIAANLDNSRPVSIVWRKKKQGDQLANDLLRDLTTRGYQAALAAGIGEISGVHFEQPITISQDGFDFNGISICAGRQAVAIETDL